MDQRRSARRGAGGRQPPKSQLVSARIRVGHRKTLEAKAQSALPFLAREVSRPREKRAHPPAKTPHESPGTQAQTPSGTPRLCRGAADRERIGAAQAGHAVRHPQAARGKGRRDLRRRRPRNPVRRLRLPAQPGSELPARPRRHLCVAQPCAPPRPAHRRHGRGPDPLAQGRRALLRADERQDHQLRPARGRPPPHQFRQPDAALPGRAAEAGNPRRDAAAAAAAAQGVAPAAGRRGRHGAAHAPLGQDRRQDRTIRSSSATSPAASST